ncbi:MAG: hypothetical protein E7331_10950 [Clostridiales bacterium]|nr:hypothetical protein [Clostridiales bacterium]
MKNITVVILPSFPFCVNETKRHYQLSSADGDAGFHPSKKQNEVFFRYRYNKKDKIIPSDKVDISLWMCYFFKAAYADICARSAVG